MKMTPLRCECHDCLGRTVGNLVPHTSHVVDTLGALESAPQSTTHSALCSTDESRVHEVAMAVAGAQGLGATAAPFPQTLDRRKTDQQKLAQAEKLAALGAIVAAVSHELNTPIGNCLTVASTMSEKTEAFQRLMGGSISRTQLDAYLQDTRTAAQLLLGGLQRAADVVARFKQVAVDQRSSQRCRFALNAAVGVVVAPLCASMRNTFLRLELDIPVVLMMDSYPGAIEQIVSILINNSIRHGFAGRDHGVMRLCAVSQGNFVCLTYCDDGHGMSAQVLQHIFDPFFTTTFGKGSSGLGMSICYNLVTGPLGGSIEVESSEGHGCRFTILLPLVTP